MFRRLLSAAVLLVIAAGLFVLVWPQAVGLQRAPIIAQVVSFRAACVIIALALVVAMFVFALASPSFRRFGSTVAILLLVFAIANAGILASRGFGDSTFAAKGANDLTVLSWNTLGDAPGAQAIAELALASDADIITLPETTEATAIAVATLMRDGGKPMWVHTTAFGLVAKSRSTSVLTSTALGTYHVDSTAGSTSVLPSVVLVPDDGSGPTIIGAHPVAPNRTELTHWHSDLDWLKTACSGDNVILAGDFNSTVDHQAGLESSKSTTIGNCSDAALATGNGAVGTWPTDVPALVGTPIDHVMATRNWRVTGMRVVQNRDNAGSDHRPIVVQLSPR
jgi:endonuclease/exonuclease/phosphatase (EEP) superfamily protein YafD